MASSLIVEPGHIFCHILIPLEKPWSSREPIIRIALNDGKLHNDACNMECQGKRLRRRTALIDCLVSLEEVVHLLGSGSVLLLHGLGEARGVGECITSHVVVHVDASVPCLDLGALLWIDRLDI